MEICAQVPQTGYAQGGVAENGRLHIFSRPSREDRSGSFRSPGKRKSLFRHDVPLSTARFEQQRRSSRRLYAVDGPVVLARIPFLRRHDLSAVPARDSRSSHSRR